jgi:hypothetical protein
MPILKGHTLAEEVLAGLRIVLVAGILAPVSALPAADTTCETLYALTDGASYVEGCFPPCECLFAEATRFRGTFTLGPETIDCAIISQKVANLYWIATIGASEVEITGSGVYRRNSGPSPPAHSLDLDLVVDGGEPEIFSSGWLPLASDGDSITIPISINGQICRDTVIVVDASPVEPDAVLEYRLADDSSYLHGCFDPCDCPLEEPRPLKGTLSLVEILNYGTYVEYAVSRATFVAPSVEPGEDDTTLNGFGLYTLIQGFAGPAHILDLRLQTDNGPTEKFDSRLFNTDPTFPAEFEIVVDTNDQTCLDTVLFLRAILSGSVVFNDGFECGTTAGWLTFPPP